MPLFFLPLASLAEDDSLCPAGTVKEVGVAVETALGSAAAKPDPVAKASERFVLVRVEEQAIYDKGDHHHDDKRLWPVQHL